MKTVEQTKNGHSFIRVSAREMIVSLSGFGICDSCCKAMFNGYLIPVLNSVYCEECFSEWQKTAEYYEEDRSYETQKTKQFLSALNKTAVANGE